MSAYEWWDVVGMASCLLLLAGFHKKGWTREWWGR
jgi:hypothetical protein